MVEARGVVSKDYGTQCGFQGKGAPVQVSGGTSGGRKTSQERKRRLQEAIGAKGAMQREVFSRVLDAFQMFHCHPSLMSEIVPVWHTAET